MLKFFNKRNMDKPENLDIENNNLVCYSFSNNTFPKEDRNKNVYIYKWNKFDGDFVSKGESVGELTFD